MPGKKKILLVEDEADFARVVQLRLTANGYDVILAADGAAGLDMAQNQQPDLVILDVMLPKMDGYKVARLLKFDEKHKKIPIIMLTARSQESDKQTGMTVGADAYLTKPFKQDELLKLISKFLSQ